MMKPPSLTPRKWLLLVVLAAMAIVCFMLFSNEKENPDSGLVYKGKDVMSWINSLKGPIDGEPAFVTVQEIGPTAVPYLIRAAAWKPSFRERCVAFGFPLQLRFTSEDRLFAGEDWRTLQRKEQRRNAAVLLLGRNGKAAASALPVLRRILNQSDDSIQLAHLVASSALLNIGPEDQDVPILIRLLTTQHDFLRLRAAECLASLGPAARASVPALERALTDRSADVQAAARSALLKIAPGEVAVPPPEGSSVGRAEAGR
jgi:hypothetical protein